MAEVFLAKQAGVEGFEKLVVIKRILPNLLAEQEFVRMFIDKATRATSEQTQAGLFKGKFSYMAPEQTRGQPIDARADVFAVGILLWELLTWRRLFKKNTEMATLIAVSEEPIASPRQLRPD